jgi:hypothetical protein
MVFLPVSSSNKGLNEDEIKREGYLPMQKITYFPRRLGGFLIGCDYQRVKQFVCHNCDRIGVFCDKHCDGIERFLEGSSSEALEYLG